MPILTIKIRFVVEPDGEGFHAFCPDLKGLHACGDTEAEALSSAKEAAQLYLRTMAKHSDPIPVGMVEMEESIPAFLGRKASRMLDSLRGRPRHSHVEEISFSRHALA